MIINLSQKVKELRKKKNLSQENLSELSGLSLRTIQRIENSESSPRGDTLNRLAKALGVQPEDILNSELNEDKNYLIIMSFSPLGFLFFPLLGIIIPLIMWVLKKDKLKGVDDLGKSILNFQITWSITLFLIYIIIFIGVFSRIFFQFLSSIYLITLPILVMYIYNITVILINSSRVYGNRLHIYKPAIKILR